MRGSEPVWFDGLKRLVSRRMTDEAHPYESVLHLLQSVIESFDCVTDDHGGSWNVEAWRSGFAAYPTGRDGIDLLAAELPHRPTADAGWRLINRNDVFSRDGPFQLFLATMAWGFGSVGYGWRRTLEILRTAGDNAVIESISVLRRSHRSHGAEGVWLAFSNGGAAKLHGLGTAFASKVAYFACYDRAGGAGPLIADRNTAWAFWALEGEWDSRNSAMLYARYVATATTWAASLNARSDDVERALFTLGPQVRLIYGQLSRPTGH